MKLDKAIEILADLQHPSGFTVSPDIKDAIGIGIEAIKAIMTGREDFYEAGGHQLPGETED